MVTQIMNFFLFNISGLIYVLLKLFFIVWSKKHISKQILKI